jgi:16S rRNA (uracil1498-N3)-methyltransferase
MRRFFVETMPEVGRRAVIRGPDARHIQAVLRLQPGERIVLSDGQGMEFEARIEVLAAGGITVAVLASRPAGNESPVAIHIAQAYLKDGKMDGLIRQMTELGVAAWMPFFSERSVPKPDPRKLAARTERWRKIGREALKQCRRGRLPSVHPVQTFEAMLDAHRDCEVKLIFWEGAAGPFGGGEGVGASGSVSRVAAVLGPEGGFSEGEIERAAAAGFRPVGLGPRILKADTAAVSAAVLLQFVFGDMGKTA